jgi:hypothetical protein
MVKVDWNIRYLQFTIVKTAPTLIDMLPNSDYIIANRGYDSEALRKHRKEKNSKVDNDDID